MQASHISRPDERNRLLPIAALLCGVLALLLSACATIERLPAVPLAMASEIKPLNIADARFYASGDPAPLEALAKTSADKARRTAEAKGIPLEKLTATFLAMSGGGDDGAFGAGLLTGWTQRGDRPEFSVVTGISTGALSAPFAFLGPDYDDELKKVYTETSANDIFSAHPLTGVIGGDSLADTTPLKNLIRRFVDKTMIARIGEEYDKGRLLLIATTNLDQSRAVIWNIGAIAKSTDPRAPELIVEVLRASASIPGAFPPVMLDVTIDGKRYEEMHVDGGAISQAFLYPPSLNLKAAAKRAGLSRKRIAYIIRNGRLFRTEEAVKRQALAIAGQAIQTMTAAAGVNDTYRIYLTTKRDGVEFNLAYIGDDFTLPYKGPFDRDYMNSLYQYGYQKGLAGYSWSKTPPGYQE